MSFEDFCASSGWSENTKLQYIIYSKLMPLEMNQEVVDSLLSKRPSNGVFRSFLRVYVHDYLKIRNIDIPRRRGRSRRILPRYLSRFEVYTVWDGIDSADTKLFFRTALETGLRVSEVLSIDRDSILQGRFVGKGGVESDLNLSKELKELLLSFCSEDGLIFSSNRKTMLNHLSSIGKKWLQKSIGPHDLRRTYGMVQRRKGNDIDKVRRNLRHVKFDTTLRYFDVSDEELAKKWPVTIMPWEGKYETDS